MLDHFFHPKSIAVIGASNNKKKVGYSLLENLKHFKGKFFPINLQEKIIQGKKAYSSVLEVNENIDLAIIAIPPHGVLDVLKQCALKKIDSIIIITAGFSEIGNKKQEEKIVDFAKKNKIRVIGPNTFGIANPYLGLDATFAKISPDKGHIGFISQSGALWSSIVDYAKNRYGFSKFVSIGNMADVDFYDVIRYLDKDEQTKVIVLYVEHLKKGKKFIDECKKSKTPIIVVKAGRTEQGKQATLSHTGSLAGSYEVYKGALRQANVILKEDVIDAFNLANILVHKKIEKKRTIIVTNAGGAGVLLTDFLEEKGCDIIKLPHSLRMSIKFKSWSQSNPIDLLGDADHKKYKEVLSKLKNKDFYDILFIVVTPQKMTDEEKIAREIIKLKKSKKIIIACFFGGNSINKAKEILQKNNIPCFRTLKQAADVF